jgi:hypothetical protein
MLDRGQVPGTPPQPWQHNKIIKRKGDNRMPEIKMKIGERKQEAEIKLLEALEDHGWGKLDILEALDSDYGKEKTDFVYVNANGQPEGMNFESVEDLMDKMEQEGGFLSITDMNTNKTHVIAVKKVDDLYVIADAPAKENMQEKIQEAMLNGDKVEVGLFGDIIEALKEFFENIVHGIEVLRNRVPEDAYTRYNKPNDAYKTGVRVMEDDEIEFTAKFNAAISRVFKDSGTIKGNPFGGGIYPDDNSTFKMVADYMFKHAENDIFRLDLNSPEACTIARSLSEAYRKADEKKFDCVAKYGEDFTLIDTLDGICAIHEVKADAEVARKKLANVTGKAYANMDAGQKEGLQKDIVAIVKAELATEFLSVLPVAGKTLAERNQKLQGMETTLKSLDHNQLLKEAIADSMKPTLKETLKSLSEKIKNKEFLKVIQNDMQKKNDASKKEETKIQKENIVSTSKGKDMAK